MNYTVEMDTIAVGGYTTYLYDMDLTSCVKRVKEILNEMEGGHADIYDEDGNFVEDVEV